MKDILNLIHTLGVNKSYTFFGHAHLLMSHNKHTKRTEISGFQEAQWTKHCHISAATRIQSPWPTVVCERVVARRSRGFYPGTPASFYIGTNEKQILMKVVITFFINRCKIYKQQIKLTWWHFWFMYGCGKNPSEFTCTFHFVLQNSVLCFYAFSFHIQKYSENNVWFLE